MTFEELLEFTRSLQGQTLQTLAKGAKYTLRVDSGSIWYTPGSTGKERGHTFRFAERVFDEFMRTRSLRPVDYQKITVNASYVLAVISMYVESNR